MRLLAPTLLISAASTAIAQEQHVLKSNFKTPKPVADAWSKPLHTLSEVMKGMTSEAKAIWDEVSMYFPEAMDKASLFSMPKPHVKKPDSIWDYIVKGADVQRWAQYPILLDYFPRR
jgi:cathepsin A (carboxypeptidase C)